MKKVDYLIVGLGLSGSILAKILSERGKKLAIIDKFKSNSSSQVAAGIVNPVSGRRVVKSWMADTLIPYAQTFYKKLESETASKFYHEIDVLEIVHSVKEVNDWSSRMSESGMSKYLSPEAPEQNYREKISPFQKMFRITSSGWMNIPLMIDRCRKILSDQLYLNEYLDQSLLQISETQISYRDIVADNIIFCEGIGSMNNSLWNWLPFLPAKGEIITIECDDLPEDFILMSGIFIVPLGDKKFRVGATYEWNYPHEEPTESGRQKLVRLLDNFLKVSYEVIEHRAGIRPTVKDRRPIIGRHPAYSNVYVFNGMGTKGVQLAPFFGEQFCEYLLNDGMLAEEVDVKRFGDFLHL